VVEIVEREERKEGGILSWLLILVIIFGLISWKAARAEGKALRLTHLGDGLFKADGTEQTVFEYERAEPFRISGQLDLGEMVGGDVVVVRQYFRVRRKEPYKLFKPEDYRDKQECPIVRITPKEAMYGYRITLQQTAGPFKTFRWIFYAGFTS